jgi:hypothetical protein
VVVVVVVVVGNPGQAVRCRTDSAAEPAGSCQVGQSSHSP